MPYVVITDAHVHWQAMQEQFCTHLQQETPVVASLNFGTSAILTTFAIWCHCWGSARRLRRITYTTLIYLSELGLSEASPYEFTPITFSKTEYGIFVPIYEVSIFTCVVLRFNMKDVCMGPRICKIILVAY